MHKVDFTFVNLGWSTGNTCIEGSMEVNIVVFILANSVDPDEMRHFIWVFTVCQRTHLGVTSSLG